MTGVRRVLGIDPGLTRCGVGVVDVDPMRRGTLVYVGVIRTPPDAPIGERLAAVAAGIRAVIAEHEPDAVAVERVFAQQNTHTVMGTAQASGVALLIAAEHGLPAATHTPSEVKAAVTGYGSADKKQVQAMIARILRLDAPPQPADAADALAIALCHAWRGAGATGGAGESDAQTPAQKAWADAERVARTYIRARA
ncbi:crossover junction endodeoxyribonuclease RuvC [Microbacterium azadirachtae]|uniref:Crossover junction endodeoxyribonuclease RuvC n=1 Tax=Microbacterium azadirachtae TaxID=582680 RepID=A0A0F0LHG0_9MICO|nr:crossover junction endodeoxyribonuclease RuvC [Microbacterium azadirachtae]KJL31695.1 Crossover junction endodeoxyribonuclease RuvC [Microbacterium azadirachtae]